MRLLAYFGRWYAKTSVVVFALSYLIFLAKLLASSDPMSASSAISLYSTAAAMLAMGAVMTIPLTALLGALAWSFAAETAIARGWDLKTRIFWSGVAATYFSLSALAIIGLTGSEDDVIVFISRNALYFSGLSVAVVGPALAYRLGRRAQRDLHA